jgi:hypothetical protein
MVTPGGMVSMPWGWRASEAVTRISELHRRWSKAPEHMHASDALEEEFDLVRTLIEARTVAGLSPSQLARRMKTSPLAVRHRAH